MFKKSFILAIFVVKSKVLSLMETLINNYGMNPDGIFVYEIEGNDREYLVTYRVYDKTKFINEIPNSKIMHFKRGCIFSINALNNLIDSEYKGNVTVTNDKVDVDWDSLNNKMLIMSNGELKINEIRKVEDKTKLFSGA